MGQRCEAFLGNIACRNPTTGTSSGVWGTQGAWQHCVSQPHRDLEIETDFHEIPCDFWSIWELTQPVLGIPQQVILRPPLHLMFIERWLLGANDPCEIVLVVSFWRASRKEGARWWPGLFQACSPPDYQSGSPLYMLAAHVPFFIWRAACGLWGKSSGRMWCYMSIPAFRVNSGNCNWNN